MNCANYDDCGATSARGKRYCKDCLERLEAMDVGVREQIAAKKRRPKEIGVVQKPPAWMSNAALLPKRPPGR